MNAPATQLTIIPDIPGTLFAGGIYAGRFFVGAQAYALIVAPKDEGEHDDTPWGSTKKEVVGALSLCNGLANTLAMEQAGSKLGKWARALRIGGCDDWYLPSRIEALVAFAELRAQFDDRWYWTSTQYAGAAEYAWYQRFYGGSQSDDHKGNELRARAVRRVPIQ